MLPVATDIQGTENEHILHVTAAAIKAKRGDGETTSTSFGLSHQHVSTLYTTPQTDRASTLHGLQAPIIANSACFDELE